MVNDTGLMEEPPEPMVGYRNTTNEFDKDNTSTILFSIFIMGIVGLNCGFRFYRSFCMRIRERNVGRYVRASETLVTRIVDVSVPSEIETTGMCPICLDELSETDIERSEDNEESRIVVKLNCGHVFHRGCLYEWLQKNTTCPICRIQV